MRDYKRKMDAFRLSPERYQKLRRYCLTAGAKEREVIEQTAAEVTDDVMARYITEHVTSSEYGVTSMLADGMPCGADTFRIYRAKFFWVLDKQVK